MKADHNRVAYIDGANLHKGVQALGWKLDYVHFRTWLTHRFGVGRAYLFLGYLSKNRDVYTRLNDAGFSLVFKEVIFDADGKAKGNCDADLIVRSMQDAYESGINGAVIVTSDGDYAPLVRFLMQKNKLLAVVSPSPRQRCSVLLRKTDAPIMYVDDKRNLLSRIKKRPPAGTHPRKGPFHSE